MVKNSSGRPIHIGLGDRSYGVEIGVNLFAAMGERLGAMFRAPTAMPLRAFLITDSNLSDALVQSVVRSLEGAGFTVAAESVVASEQEKSIPTVERLLTTIARTKHERRDPVIAIGGGIIGDIAGFVGATYRRGVPVIQCPTTLLAMVDASVGGKTGVNLRIGETLAKNMVGSFWQPRLVIADIAALRSLPDRHLRAGLAECLKHGMIAGAIDPELFDWTLSNLPRIHCRDEEALADLVARNVAVKARIVEGDEREESEGAGARALLNLGHTFAHAIETIPHLSPDSDPANAPLLHGEAVGLGLIAASAAARHCGRVDRSFVNQVIHAVAQAGLPTAVADLPPAEHIFEAMTHDKKVSGGRVRLVLPRAPGAAELVGDAPRESIVAGIEAISH